MKRKTINFFLSTFHFFLLLMRPYHSLALNINQDLKLLAHENTVRVIGIVTEGASLFKSVTRI